MLAFLGFMFFGVIYCVARRNESKSRHSTLVRVAMAGIKRVAGTAAVVGAVFVVVQIVMWMLRAMSWAHTTLLNIENTLVNVRRIIDLLEAPSYLLVSAGILLILLLAMPTIGFINNTARRILTATTWLARLSFVLTIVTSLTFFGAGSKEGFASLEAKLVDERKAITRGYTEFVETAEEAAPAIVAEAMVELVEDEKLIQQIVKSSDYDDLIKPYPLISCLINNDDSDSSGIVSCESLKWDLVNSEMKRVLRHVVTRVAKPLANASVRQFTLTQVESKLKDILRRPLSSSVSGYQLSDIPRSGKAATQAGLERAKENLRNGRERILRRARDESQAGSVASTIRNIIRHSVSIGYDGTAETALSGLRAAGEQNAAYNFVELFVDEALHEPIREIVHFTTELIMDKMFDEYWSLSSLSDDIMDSVKTNVRNLYENTLKGRAKILAGDLQNERQSLVNLLKQDGKDLKNAAQLLQLETKSCLELISPLLQKTQ